MKTESELKKKENKNNPALLDLNLLPFASKCKIREGKIWDPTRRRWLEKEPEELVRQGLIRYLHENLNFPYSRMRSEYQIMYNNLRKRLDLVLFDKNGRAFLLAEVKSWKVRIDQRVLKQLGTYNMVCKAPYILACNGTKAILAGIDQSEREVSILNEWPDWKEDYEQNA